jgi:hypothetical protein
MEIKIKFMEIKIEELDKNFWYNQKENRIH